jgi:hypothetical protein
MPASSVRKLASFCNFVRGPKRRHSAIAPVRPRARRRTRIGFVPQFLPKTNLASFCNHAHVDPAAAAPRRQNWLRSVKSRGERIPRLAPPAGPVFPEDGAGLFPDRSKPKTLPTLDDERPLKPSPALTAPNRTAVAPCAAPCNAYSSWWGGPPGPQPTPPSASLGRDKLDPGQYAGPGGPARTRGSAPPHHPRRRRPGQSRKVCGIGRRACATRGLPATKVRPRITPP